MTYLKHIATRVSPCHTIGENLALEWGRVRTLDDTPKDEPIGPELLFYVNDPCVVLGRTRKVGNDLTAEALAQPQGFLSRRRSGGGTVYHDRNNLNFSVILPRDFPGLPQGPKDAACFVLKSVVDALGGTEAGAAIERISDVTVKGLKVSGNAQYRGRRVLLHHGTLLLRADVPVIVRWLKLPPERPDVKHEDFVTDLAALGHSPDAGRWRKRLGEAFAHRLGLPLQEVTFTQEELAEAHRTAGEWIAPDWVRKF